MKRMASSKKTKTVVSQMENRKKSPAEEKKVPALLSTGSTLLDLAISGGVYPGGGITGGNLVEIFGPPGTGKTVLLCEMAGGVQRAGGAIQFMDPEGRLNATFAELFGLCVDDVEYSRPDTVPGMFHPIRKWKPKPDGKLHCVFADSLAALSTDMEMGSEDKMGMRRAKEFSEECRKTCRVLANTGLSLICSNQVRTRVGAGLFEEKVKTPGGEAIPFYASVRLQTSLAKKLKVKKTAHGKEHTRFYGILIKVKVYKNSIWEPYHVAPVYIIFDYGVDDVRANLMYLKDVRALKKYELAGESWSSINAAIAGVEERGLVDTLKRETISQWEELEQMFKVPRKPKWGA